MDGGAIGSVSAVLYCSSVLGVLGFDELLEGLALTLPFLSVSGAVEAAFCISRSSLLDMLNLRTYVQGGVDLRRNGEGERYLLKEKMKDTLFEILEVYDQVYYIHFYSNMNLRLKSR